MSDSKLRRIIPKEQREKISQSLKGRQRSLETRLKISQGMRQAWARTPKPIDYLNKPSE